MNITAIITAILLSVLGSFSMTCEARSRVGIYFGAPLSYPYYTSPYYPSPYYYPPVVVPVPTEPPTYIERAPQPSEQYPSGFWYYCHQPEGYYPQVKACPRGWEKVAPVPADVAE